MKTADAESSTEPRQAGIQVIARAGAILRTLGSHPTGLSLGDIAREVTLPRSTVQRIIGALEQEGMVAAMAGGSGFRLGPELGRLVHQSQVDVLSIARPMLVELSRELQETVSLCRLDGERVQVIERIIAERELRVVPPIGVIQVPFHSTAPGKALLATLADERVERLLLAALPDDEARRAGLRAEITAIRAGCIAADNEEYLEGLVAYSLALDTYLGHFAITVMVPASPTRARRERYIAPLQAFKQRLEARIGAPAAA